jgi:DNA replication licensing factor MCM4
MKEGYFRCSICFDSLFVGIDRGRIEEPSRCKKCGTERSMMLIHNRSIFSDKQMIKLQETPENIPEGETPHTVNLCSFDSLVDEVKPGDRIDITGIFRVVPQRLNAKMRRLKTIFKSFIDVIHYRKTGNRMSTDESNESEQNDKDEKDEKYKLTKKEEEKIKNLSKNPNIYELLTNSLAPGIWKMDDVKKGILCQLFGGTNKKFSNGTKIRGELHVLLMGDPGISKR